MIDVYVSGEEMHLSRSEPTPMLGCWHWKQNDGLSIFGAIIHLLRYNCFRFFVEVDAISVKVILFADPCESFVELFNILRSECVVVQN